MQGVGLIGSFRAVEATSSDDFIPRAVGFTPTDALLGFMVLVWGLNYILIKAVLREIAPLPFNAGRFAIAGLTLAGVAVVMRAPRPARADLGRLFLLGLLGNTVYQFGFIEGVAHTRASNAALIMAAVPVQTAVLSHLRGLERLRPRDSMGLALSTAGIVTIVLGSTAGVRFGTGPDAVGDLIVFLATICWSLYIVGSKPMVDRYGAVTTTAWTMVFGAVPLVLVSIPAVLAQQWRAVSPQAIGGMALSSLGALVVAYLIWFRGVQRLGPARTALYSNFTPLIVSLSAWPLLGEVPTLWQAAGAAGIFGGIWLTRT